MHSTNVEALPTRIIETVDHLAAEGFDIMLEHRPHHRRDYRLLVVPMQEPVHTNANIERIPRRHHQYIGATPTRPADPDGGGPDRAA